MNNPAQPISAYLSGAPHAQVLGRLDLGLGRVATLWRNRDARIRYDNPLGHVLSFYSRGGTGTRRLDPAGTAAGHGWTGAICLMPQGHASDWEITESFDFLHLYLPDDELRRSYAQTCDRDARLLDLADLTFIRAPDLTQPFRQLEAALRLSDPLEAEGAMHELLGRIFQGPRYGGGAGAPLRGGLSPRKLRLLRDHIEAHLAQPIHLRDLAALAGISEFHLQRSFRASCGVSPQRWIAALRIQRACAMIAMREPLLQVALACGFDSQSHFTRSFKATMGIPPGQWRAAVLA